MYSNLLVVVGMIPFVAMALFWVYGVVKSADSQGVFIEEALANSPLKILNKSGIGHRKYSFDFSKFNCKLVVHPRGTDGPHGMQLKFGSVALQNKHLFISNVDWVASLRGRIRFLSQIEGLSNLPTYKCFSNDPSWASEILSSNLVELLQDISDWPLDLNLKQGNCNFSVWRTMESTGDCEKFVNSSVRLLEIVCALSSCEGSI